MTDMRRCIGSAKFGIAAHDAPPEDFPVQPSQKDGLGRMCKPHWTEYTRALGRARTARKADADPVVAKLAKARAKGAALAGEAKGPAIQPVPKPAKKPARGRKRSAFALPDPKPSRDALAPEPERRPLVPSLTWQGVPKSMLDAIAAHDAEDITE